MVSHFFRVIIIIVPHDLRRQNGSVKSNAYPLSTPMVLCGHDSSTTTVNRIISEGHFELFRFRFMYTLFILLGTFQTNAGIVVRLF